MITNPNLLGVNRRLQAKHTKYCNFHITETTASSQPNSVQW